MFDTKKNYLYILHSVIPLFCGLFIYLTIKEDTFISYALSSLRSIMPVIDYPVIIRNFVAYNQKDFSNHSKTYTLC